MRSPFRDDKRRSQSCYACFIVVAASRHPDKCLRIKGIMTTNCRTFRSVEHQCCSFGQPQATTATSQSQLFRSQPWPRNLSSVATSVATLVAFASQQSSPDQEAKPLRRDRLPHRSTAGPALQSSERSNQQSCRGFKATDPGQEKFYWCPPASTEQDCTISHGAANPGNAGVFSCAASVACGSLHVETRTDCAAFCAASKPSPVTAVWKCSSVVIR